MARTLTVLAKELPLAELVDEDDAVSRVVAIDFDLATANEEQTVVPHALLDDHLAVGGVDASGSFEESTAVVGWQQRKNR